MARVVLVHPSGDLYGSDRMFLRTADALNRAGHELRLVLPTAGTLADEARARGFAVDELDSLVLRKRMLSVQGLMLLLPKAIGSFIKVANYLRRTRPEAIYINTITIPVWASVAYLFGVQSMTHVREAEEIGGLLSKVLLAPLFFNRAVITNSRATQSVVLTAFKSLEPRTSVIYNGLDFPAPLQRGHRAAVSRIVVVGRLSPRKGQDIAIKALAILRSRGFKVTLELVGDCFKGYEWFEKDLRKLAREEGVGAAVQFTGFARDVWDAYCRADIAVVPSRVEPFGTVALESMAMGIPTVASRVQGLREIVSTGRTGLLVEPDDPELLADACDRLLTDGLLTRRLSVQGLDDVRERFSSERYRREISKVLDGVLWRVYP